MRSASVGAGGTPPGTAVGCAGGGSADGDATVVRDAGAGVAVDVGGAGVATAAVTDGGTVGVAGCKTRIAAGEK
jgi:hypothetical protein